MCCNSVTDIYSLLFFVFFCFFSGHHLFIPPFHMLMVSSVVFEFWSIWFLHVYFKGHSRLKLIVIQDLFRTMTSPTLSSQLLLWVLSYNSFMLFELLKGQNYAVWASLVARRERICLSCQSCRRLG